MWAGVEDVRTFIQDPDSQELLEKIARLKRLMPPKDADKAA